VVPDERKNIIKAVNAALVMESFDAILHEITEGGQE